MPILDDLLAKGFFPQELPPCFSSASFAPIAALSAGALPPAFADPLTSKPCPYSFARGGTGAIRRLLSVVNPVAFYAVAQVVATNWAAIDTHLQGTPLSQSRPMHWPGASRAFKTLSYANRFLVAPKARNRSAARAFLLADLSQFYHSIYTHSIAWAFHSKAIAKVNHSHLLFGNRIDALVQRGQDRQTRGIPIGPDTSLVIAESILAEVERCILQRLPNLRGIRFIDDYELCFPDFGSAENALSIIQEELQHFELQLNSKKTRIVSPPIRFEPEWVGDFRTFVLRANSGQHGDLVRFFDLITKSLEADIEAHVAKYAISKLLLQNFVPRPEIQSLYQALLCQLLLTQPSAAKEIISCLVFLATRGVTIDTSLVMTSFREVIKRACPLGHHYEISWVLYGILRLGLTIDQATAAVLSNCDNAVIALMSLNAWQRGLAPSLNATLWASHMTVDDLHDEHWPLSYEASRLGWLPSLGVADHIASDVAFDLLRARGVNFYQPI
jgi:Reverse transcriptase (RNA-dependent DNA polymerase)